MSQFEKPHILIVDDSATIRNSITKHLGDDYAVTQAANGEQAWKCIQSDTAISLVFADLHMPVMNGMALLKLIRDHDNEHIAQLPIIMITGHEDTDAAKRASYSMGATDFLSKPFSIIDIQTRARAYTSFNNKISNLEQNLTNDQLTGLYNKNGFEQMGDKSMASARRYDHELSILSLQINNIKNVTEKHGKKVAAQIIISVAKSLQKLLRKEDCLAHIGNGQFAITLPVTKSFRANIVAIRFQSTINNLAFKTSDSLIRVRLAIGLNSTEKYNGAVSFVDMVRHADASLRASLKCASQRIITYELGSENQSASQLADDKLVQDASAESETVIETDLISLSEDEFSRYMGRILRGEFEQIPTHHQQQMIDPVNAFLDHVCEQTERMQA